VGNGTLKELTKRYEELIKGYGIDKWGATNFDGNALTKALASIQAIPICRGCLKGGGNEECKMRPCAANKKVSDCIECGKSKMCKNREAFQKVRSGALAVGMLLKTDKNKTNQQLIEKWTAEIKNKFPNSVINI
jgi:hypothetical protein